MGSTNSPHDGHAVAVNCWFACVSIPPPSPRPPIVVVLV